MGGLGGEERAEAFDGFAAVRDGEFLVAGEFGEGGVRVVAEEEWVVAEACGAAWGVEYGAVGVCIEGDLGASDVGDWRRGRAGRAGGVVELCGGAECGRFEGGLDVGGRDDDEAKCASEVCGALCGGRLCECANEFSVVGGGAVGVGVDVGWECGVARAVDAWGTLERVDREAGVVGDGVLCECGGECAGFDAGVFDEGGAVFVDVECDGGGRNLN